MVRKLLCLLALLAAARAAQAQALPEDVRTLVGAAYPGCGIIACDGWEDGQRGQFAVVVQDGERRILCIAERTAQDAGYALTVDNPRALPEGSTLRAAVCEPVHNLYAAPKALPGYGFEDFSPVTLPDGKVDLRWSQPLETLKGQSLHLLPETAGGTLCTLLLE